MTKATKVPGQAPTDDAPVHAAEADTLPYATEVDAKDIKGPVLTQQGWVVPDESAKKPNGPR